MLPASGLYLTRDIIIDGKNKAFLENFRDFAYFEEQVQTTWAFVSDYELYRKFFKLNAFINELLKKF